MAVEFVEATVLAGCAGARVVGVVVDLHDDDATVQLRRPAVVAVVRGAGKERGVALGDEVELRVGSADAAGGPVQLTVV